VPLNERVGIAGVIREFLVVHKELAELVDRYRSDDLSFDLVESLVGDGPSSALYRLKEKCHSIFRADAGGAPVEFRTEALFDLAIGSLFHEAMILRENLYQQERYGSRVDALKTDANPLAPELSREFERILSSSASRLEESVLELEALLALTSSQLIRLLIEDADNDLLARCLYEEREAVEMVFSREVQTLFVEIHGSEETGFMKAATSYIDSGFYEEALQILGQLRNAPAVKGASAFAQAMKAFLARDYACCVENLATWLTCEGIGGDRGRVALALAAAKHVEKSREVEISPEIRLQIAALNDLGEKAD
jgi:hypothetical protein